MIHLTFTGVQAGRPFCGIDRDANPDARFAHFVYAPVDLPAYRADICRDCLRAVLSTYDPGEDRPAWAGEVTQ